MEIGCSFKYNELHLAVEHGDILVMCRYMSSSVRLSVVCLSVCRLSVTLVHPTQLIEIFSNVSTTYGTFDICWDPGKILRRSSQGNPCVEGVKHKRGSQI